MTGICSLQQWGRGLIAALCALTLGACSTLGAAGPSAGNIREAGEREYADTGIQVVELGAEAVAQLNSYSASTSFAEVFGDTGVSPTVVGPGDILDIAIWEAPPSVLFGSTAGNPRLAVDSDAASVTEIPQQQIGEDGRISVPFVGRIEVAGLRPEQIEAIITSRLRGRANDPQAVVRLARNESRTVTVLGNVRDSGRVVLSARGERLLDALASAGGTQEDIEESTVQLARGTNRAVMPLEQVIADPAQNVGLRPDDVITVQHKPFSFVALGAVNQNAEIPFEGVGISLAEALGRAGGLNDRRANVRGVFIFRLEDQEAVGPLLGEPARTTSDGRIPVVYSLKMSDAESLFAMQDFRMRDGDVLYISTAPGVELERFLQTISSTAFTIFATGNAIGNQ